MRELLDVGDNLRSTHLRSAQLLSAKRLATKTHDEPQKIGVDLIQHEVFTAERVESSQ